jgi:hypothetical protein
MRNCTNCSCRTIRQVPRRHDQIDDRFASLTHEDERATIGVTVKTVNHRFLDVQLRIPQSLAEIESRVRALCRSGWRGAGSRWPSACSCGPSRRHGGVERRRGPRARGRHRAGAGAWPVPARSRRATCSACRRRSACASGRRADPAADAQLA